MRPWLRVNFRIRPQTLIVVLDAVLTLVLVAGLAAQRSSPPAAALLLLAGGLANIAWLLYAGRRLTGLSGGRTALAVLGAVAAGLLVVAPVLADYLGPHRSFSNTTYQRLRCRYHAYVPPPNLGNCDLTLYFNPDDGCASPYDVRGYFTASACSWSNNCTALAGCTVGLTSASAVSCNPGDSGCKAYTTTSSYPEATISGIPQCAQPGNGGWCLSPADLALTGIEPVAGEYVSAIEGTRNSAPFLCDGVSSCTLPLLEGPNAFTFWALSSFGDSSRMGTASLGVDTQSPSLTSSITGQRVGLWYTSAVLHASADDPAPGSGLAALQYSLDGAAWTSLSGSYSIPDGQYTLDVRAVDNAGRMTQSGQYQLSVDATPPLMTVDLSGISGDAGWFTSAAQVVATATDATSGLAKFEFSLDGSGWQSYVSGLTLSDGLHSISFFAEDAAGQSVQVDRAVNVDTVSPQVGGQPSGTHGSNGWYISPVTVAGTAVDPSPGSGIASFSFALDGGAPISYLNPLTLSDGQHTVIWSARDVSGRTASASQNISIDSQPPSLQVSTVLPAWIQDSLALTGTAGDGLSGLLQVDVSADNGSSWLPASGTSSWSYAWNSSLVPDGGRTLRVRALDAAGLTTEAAFLARVDNHGPIIRLPDSWDVWDTVTLRVEDAGIGLAEVRVVISDPDGRWPARKLEFGPGDFPLDLKWDRRFKDGTVAPTGRYEVEVTAIDRLGHDSLETAHINIPLTGIIVPAPATSTAVPTRIFTPTSDASAALVLPAAFTPTPGVSVAPAVLGMAADEPPAAAPILAPAPHLAPVGESVEFALANLFSTPGEDASSGAAAASNVLWGAEAAAAIAAATAFVLDQRRKRDEEEAQAAAAAAHASAAAVAAQQHFADFTVVLPPLPPASPMTLMEPETPPIGGVHARYSPIPWVGDPADKEEISSDDTRELPIGISPDARAAYEHAGPAAQQWIAQHAQELQKMPAGLSPAQQSAVEHSDAAAQSLTPTSRANRPEDSTPDVGLRPAPSGLSPEMLAAYYHSAAAASWITQNAERLRAEYQRVNPIDYFGNGMLRAATEHSESAARWFDDRLQDFEQKLPAFLSAIPYLHFYVPPEKIAALEEQLFWRGELDLMGSVNNAAFFYPSAATLEGNPGEYIYRNDRLIWTGNLKFSDDGTFLEVKKLEKGKWTIGWVNSKYLILAPDATLSAQPGTVDVGSNPRPDEGARQYISITVMTGPNGQQIPTLQINGRIVTVEGLPTDVLRDLCGEWSVAYAAGIPFSQFIDRVFIAELEMDDPDRIVRLADDAQVMIDGKLVKIPAYRINTGSLLYEAFHNQASWANDLQDMAEIISNTETTRINEADAMKLGGEFWPLPGLMRDQLLQGQRLVMGVRTDGDCNFNANAGSDHFIEVTDVFFENDRWMVRYYDPWVDALKVAPYGDPSQATHDPASFIDAAYKFNYIPDDKNPNKTGSYTGFFVPGSGSEPGN